MDSEVTTESNSEGRSEAAERDRPPFRVKDLGLAAWGRREIELAEMEMPGLMALRAEFGLYFV